MSLNDSTEIMIDSTTVALNTHPHNFLLDMTCELAFA